MAFRVCFLYARKRLPWGAGSRCFVCFCAAGVLPLQAELRSPAQPLVLMLLREASVQSAQRGRSSSSSARQPSSIWR